MVSAKDARIWFTAGGIIIGGLLGQIVTAQYIENKSLVRELRITNQALRIESEQTAELMYQLQRLQAERDTVATQNFVAGITAAFDKQNRYNEIWHAGYDRGSAVQQYVDSLDTQTSAQYTGQNKK
jgi:Tfp pilus assembly protein PilN